MQCAASVGRRDGKINVKEIMVPHVCSALHRECLVINPRKVVFKTSLRSYLKAKKILRSKADKVPKWNNLYSKRRMTQDRDVV